LARVDRSKKDYLEGLWAYWAFEDPTTDTIYDQSGNERDGIGYNLEKIKGILGDAYWFNGTNSYVAIPSDVATLPEDAITVSLWYYTPEQPTQNRILISKHYTYTITSPFRSFKATTYSMGIYLTSDLIRFAVSRAQGDVNTISADIIWGRWVHVAGTWDGEIQRLYVDGELKAEVEYSGSLYQALNPIYIGRFHTDHYFYGKIDEVMIFEKALTETEVRKLYEIYKRERQKVKVRVV